MALAVLDVAARHSPTPENHGRTRMVGMWCLKGKFGGETGGDGIGSARRRTRRKAARGGNRSADAETGRYERYVQRLYIGYIWHFSMRDVRTGSSCGIARLGYGVARCEAPERRNARHIGPWRHHARNDGSLPGTGDAVIVEGQLEKSPPHAKGMRGRRKQHRLERSGGPDQGSACVGRMTGLRAPKVVNIGKKERKRRTNLRVIHSKARAACNVRALTRNREFCTVGVWSRAGLAHGVQRWGQGLAKRSGVHGVLHSVEVAESAQGRHRLWSSNAADVECSGSGVCGTWTVRLRTVRGCREPANGDPIGKMKVCWEE
ncbi:hypothetical protein DFH06DRAFT_1134600 [Mycena polygramma]|nr:hypothetical protein DFH06DRAFT_1134600 [Mycena polygramma]